MEDRFKTIFKEYANGVSLTADEKARMKERVHSFMRETVVRNVEPARLNMQSRKNIINSFAFLRLTYMPALALVFLLFVSGGMTYAAEGSLPGDMLYPVKVNISEPVRHYLQFSTESKADLAADLARRRLVEAEELAASGKLDASVAAQLEANFTAYADRAASYMNELQANGDIAAAARVSTTIETSLLGHSELLRMLGIAKAEAHNEIKQIRKSVDDKRGGATSVRAEIEANAAKQLGAQAEATAEAELDIAQKAVASARGMLNNVKDSLSADAKANAEAQLAAAQTDIAQANVQISANAYADAFGLLKRAIRMAHALELWLNAQSRLKLDLSIDAGSLHININDDRADRTDTDDRIQERIDIQERIEGRVTVPSVSPAAGVHIQSNTQINTDSAHSESVTNIRLGF